MLKEFLRLDYRGPAALLADHPELYHLIGLEVVPHFTIFQKAAARLLAAIPGRKMFDSVIEAARRAGLLKRRVPLAAANGTGMESRHFNRYYVKRRAKSGDTDEARTYAHFPRVVLVVDCASHLVLAAVPGRGPGSDLVQFGRTLGQAVRRARIGVLVADADFDAEWVHQAARAHGIRAIIPPARGRPSDKPPRGHWRRLMKERFGQFKRWYGQMSQAETVNSMIKRLQGSALRAREFVNQRREIILCNVMHGLAVVSSG